MNWPDALELISARDVRLQGVTVRHAKSLSPSDIRTAQGISVSSPARTALDLGLRVSQKELTRIINDLRHVNGLKVHELRDVIARNPRHPGTRQLRAKLRNILAARKADQ